MEDYKDQDFTKEAVENLGKFGIHPLNEDGKELYVSKDFYNYHFLTKKDPELLRQVEEKMKKDREEELRKLQEVYKREEKKRKEAMGIFEDDEEEKKEEPIIEEQPVQNEIKKPKVKKAKKGYNGPWPYPTHYITKSTLKNPYLEKKNIKKKTNVSNEPMTGVAAVKGSEKPLIMKEKGNIVKMPKITKVYSGHKTMKEYDSSEVTTF